MTPEDAVARLEEFVDWRPRLWAPAVRWLLGDPTRFAGRTVLDLGCRYGKMSCFFGLLGARVLGVDTDAAAIPRAEAERDRHGLTRVDFEHYDGDPASLERHFDFVFTKSVLVVVPDLDRVLRGIAASLSPEGQLLAAENAAGGRLLDLARRHLVHREWRGVAHKLHGVDEAFFASFPQTLDVTEQRTFWHLVTAFRAHPRPAA